MFSHKSRGSKYWPQEGTGQRSGSDMNSWEKNDQVILVLMMRRIRHDQVYVLDVSSTDLKYFDRG